MDQIITITYALRTNHMQYQYVCHEISKVQRMYARLLKQKQTCQRGFDELQSIKGYAKHYLPEMSQREMEHMVRCLRANKQEFLCYGSIDGGLQWRSLGLYPLLIMPYDWMRVPLVQKWKIIGSSIYVKGGGVYLTLRFDKHS